MIKKLSLLFTLLALLPTFSLRSQITFTQITSGPVVNDVMNAIGCSWVDYDNDGDLDLFVANASDNNALYRNDGTGSLTRITSGAIVTDSRGPGSWGDYDNDGDLDLFVAGLTTQLYRNNGDGSFVVAASGVIVGDGSGSGSASWVDFDSDGDLDLFAIRTNSLVEGGASFLSLNNGDGSFTSVAEGMILSDGGGESAAWGDYDSDGDLDLFVPITAFESGASPNNRLYQNEGNGSFSRITTGEIVNDGASSVLASWADYDNDGDLDLFVINGDATEPDFLYQNSGNGTFAQILNGPVVSSPGRRSRGSSWGDYDNDGDLDLFVSHSIGNHTLYENDGAGVFTEITEGAIAAETGGIRPSWGDYDNDGDLDLFVARLGTSLLYENNGTGNNWIKVALVGTASNRSAVGAKVRLRATINGSSVWQLREISGQTGNPLKTHFGLGVATVVDSLIVEWPSGTRQVLTDVVVNRFLSVTEILPPQPEHSPITLTESNNETVIEANVTGNVFETELHYRRGGEAAFTVVSMSDLGGGLYRGAIPAGAVTARGLEYRILARDRLGNTGELPAEGSFAVRVHVSNGLSRGVAQPFGSVQTAYRIFSVPLDLDDPSPQALFEDDLGEYDDRRWRFSEFVGNNTYLEFPQISKIVPGKGYWFLVSEPARVIDTGAGTSVTTGPEFAISLQPGWNLIGNPFNFTIPVENLRLDDGSPAVLRTFAGDDTASWNNPVTEPVTEILPFEGYALFLDDVGNRGLLIDPNMRVSELAKSVHPSTSLRMKRSLQGEPFDDAQDKLRRTMNLDGQPPNQEIPEQGRNASGKRVLWSINLRAQCQQARDADNVLGVAALASESWDSLDFPEPPPIGEYVSVYFDHPEWGKRSQRFCTDFRPPESATHLEGASHLGSANMWEFEVQTNIRDRVELTFDGLETVPKEFDVWLLDEVLGLTQNLRRNPQYSVAGVGEDHPKRLKLLVGRGDFVDELLPQQEIPTDFELSQNFPNPFNPVTSIRYGLPRETNVTLKIFNILGEEVATLLDDERLSAGFHLAIWDGRNGQGRPVASGVYLYQLLIGELMETRKMALVR